MATEYKSFFKTVSGGEGDRCNYPTRLDTYGKGCANNCSYCYARSLLEFRKLWDPDDPGVADIEKIRRTIKRKLNPGDTVRLGGMTDCFQHAEKTHKVTYETIKALNERGVNYLIVTKNPLVASPEYMEVMDRDLAHIQVSVTTTDDAFNTTYEHAEPFSERKRAIETLYRNGFDVQVRLSPYIPDFVDIDEINAIDCDRILIEFLRVNAFVRRTFDIDYSDWTLREGNYYHMPLERKLELLSKITGFDEVSVCDDVDEHYLHFQNHVNANPDDCCNLRIARLS